MNGSDTSATSAPAAGVTKCEEQKHESLSHGVKRACRKRGVGGGSAQTT